MYNPFQKSKLRRKLLRESKVLMSILDLKQNQSSPILKTNSELGNVYYKFVNTSEKVTILFEDVSKIHTKHPSYLIDDILYIWDSELHITRKIPADSIISLFGLKLKELLKPNELVNFELSQTQKERICLGKDIKLMVLLQDSFVPKIYFKSFQADLSFFLGKTSFFCLEKDIHHKNYHSLKTQNSTKN